MGVFGYCMEKWKKKIQFFLFQTFVEVNAAKENKEKHV